jgi:TatD DNase family protein
MDTTDSMVTWTDSHCHLPADASGVEIIDDARRAGVARMINIGTDAEQSAAAIGVARAHDGVWATVGLHPHDAKHGLASIESLVEVVDPKVVGIGECGLDYHYDYSQRDVQRQVFAAQIAMAHRLGLALVIHTREAWDDTFDILAAEGVPEHTVVHCFTGGPDEARRSLEIGAWLSFSGIVTFKNAADVRAAAELCPPERMLVETDAPFLTPVPYRGTPNRPALVPLVGEVLADVKQLPVEEVAEVTARNASEVFALGELPG